MTSSRERTIIAALLLSGIISGVLLWRSLGREEDLGERLSASDEERHPPTIPLETKQAPVVTRDRDEAPPATQIEPSTRPLPSLPTTLPRLRLLPQEPDLGTLDTAGELSKTQGAQAVAAFYPHAIRCLLKTRQKEAHVGSRITLRLRVAPGGPGETRVLDLDALDRGKTSPTLRRCLRQALPQVKLNLGPDARGTVTAPMVLGPDNDPPPAPQDPPQMSGTVQTLPPGEGSLEDEVIPVPGDLPSDLDDEESVEEPPGFDPKTGSPHVSPVLQRKTRPRDRLKKQDAD